MHCRAYLCHGHPISNDTDRGKYNLVQAPELVSVGELCDDEVSNRPQDVARHSQSLGLRGSPLTQPCTWSAARKRTWMTEGGWTFNNRRQKDGIAVEHGVDAELAHGK